MVRAMGFVGLLVGLILVSAVLVNTSLRHGAPRTEPKPDEWEPDEWEPDDRELDSQPVPENSLWPLPQWVHTSRRQLQLVPGRFQLVHGAGSAAGPDCGLLQDAFRRYYEYTFGQSRRREWSRRPPGLRAELSQLQVVIESADPGCQSYPHLGSSEA